VVGALRSSDGHVPPERHEEEALETLRKRYARGEITREEYREMRQDLA
jgi:uncharacterized membrane protein